MNRQAIITTALSICILLSTDTQVKSGDNISVPTISVTKLDVTDKSLELSWEIRNDSKQDTWILTGLDRSGATISAFVAEDRQTLLMRRRLDMPWIGNTPFPACNGRYERLRAGQILTESASLAIPIWPDHDQVLVGSIPIRNDSKQLRRLSIEIGYYTGDLSGTIHHALEQDEKIPSKVPSVDR